MILTVFLLIIVCSCTSLVTRPSYVYYDNALDKKVVDQKKKIIKDGGGSSLQTKQILDNYETLRQKSKKAIELNNKRALK
jgi:hypothetical protein